MTFEGFARLLLSDRQQGLQVTDLVGGYLWASSPRWGAEGVAVEARRRISEGIENVKVAVDFAWDFYALFNPFWEVLQITISVGKLIQEFKGK